MPIHRKPNASHIGRRRFLGGVALTGAAGLVPAAAEANPAPAAQAFAETPSYLFAAKEAARWVRSAEIRVDGGAGWMPVPDHPDMKATVSPPDGFYSGAAGTLLFFIELAAVTGDASYLDDARRGGDFLIRSWRAAVSPNPDVGTQYSFYTGLAGSAYTLAELWKATGDATFRDAALGMTNVLLKAAKPAGKGSAWMGWPGLTGNGGVVLVLLSLADLLAGTTDTQAIRAAAIRAGDRMIEQGIPDPRGGVRWEGMPPSFLDEPDGTYWPGFQLGTSGAAFALARLGAVTGETRFIDAAKAGALHLQSIATVKGDAALIHYREPDLTDIFYLGYCNGPAGTARLFYQLYAATKDRHYLDWTEMLARGVIASGIPEKQTPGFWNVICQCCGSAGVTDFFVGLWAATGKKEYLAFARRVADQMLSREMNLDGKGYRWYQAYTRVKPWDVTAETGYMIGAAGIGAALLHLHMIEAGLYGRAIRLPDNPFPIGA